MLLNQQIHERAVWILDEFLVGFKAIIKIIDLKTIINMKSISILNSSQSFVRPKGHLVLLITFIWVWCFLSESMVRGFLIGLLLDGRVPE